MQHHISEFKVRSWTIWGRKLPNDLIFEPLVLESHALTKIPKSKSINVWCIYIRIHYVILYFLLQTVPQSCAWYDCQWEELLLVAVPRDLVATSRWRLRIFANLESKLPATRGTTHWIWPWLDSTKSMAKQHCIIMAGEPLLPAGVATHALLL